MALKKSDRRTPIAEDVESWGVDDDEEFGIPVPLEGPIEHLRRLVRDDPEALRAFAQERVRSGLAIAFCQLRSALGLSQQDMADRLGISQGRISRLESVHYDRRMDSVAAYLHAAGAELLMAVRVGEEVIEVVGSEAGWRQAGAALGTGEAEAEDEAAG